MKTITLLEAFALLKQARCAIVDFELADIFFDDLSNNPEGSPENKFVHFQWEDEEGTCAFACSEGLNQTVTIKEDVMILIDTDGDPVEVQLLKPFNLEKE